MRRAEAPEGDQDLLECEGLARCFSYCQSCFVDPRGACCGNHASVKQRVALTIARGTGCYLVTMAALAVPLINYPRRVCLLLPVFDLSPDERLRFNDKSVVSSALRNPVTNGVVFDGCLSTLV